MGWEAGTLSLIDQVVTQLVGDGAEGRLRAESDHALLRPGSTLALLPPPNGRFADRDPDMPGRRQAVAGVRSAPAVERHPGHGHLMQAAGILNCRPGPGLIGCNGSQLGHERVVDAEALHPVLVATAAFVCRQREQLR